MNQLMQSQYNKDFYTPDEIKELGFASIGNNVLLSRYARIYGAQSISIGNNVRIDDFVILSGKIEIGNFVHIGAFSSITGGKAGVRIGDFCGMSSQSKIFATTDDFLNGYLVGPCVPMEMRNVIEKPVLLTKHCHIGSHSLVLPGSIFELGACLGPMSLNMGRKFKEWSYYLGNPAKKVYDIKKERILGFSELYNK